MRRTSKVSLSRGRSIRDAFMDGRFKRAEQHRVLSAPLINSRHRRSLWRECPGLARAGSAASLAHRGEVRGRCRLASGSTTPCLPQSGSRARRVRRGSVGNPPRSSLRPAAAPTGAARVPCGGRRFGGVGLGPASCHQVPVPPHDRGGGDDPMPSAGLGQQPGELRASSPSQAMSCRKIRYSSRTATTGDHARRPLSSDAAGHRRG